ncbi:HET-domain-containing protein, partial [Cadophora sp. DSE1049]
YAALSYCWGADQPNALKSSTYAHYMEAIDVAIIPWSINDAIISSRRLGLTYLWVDSLCILQDNDVDKTKEIGKMAGIYANAYVTISAAVASTCDDGFLQKRTIGEPERFRLPFHLPDGQIGNIFVYGLGQINARISELIARRAWILQERFMSRRTLIVQQQLLWSCLEEWGKDGGGITKGEYFT